MFREVRSDFSAKIPSVLFKTPSLGDTQVQLGINGEFGCQTSKLLGTYYEIDSRLAILATAFRYWAKVCRIFKERITARKRSLGQGNIFAPVCYSVHRGPSTWAGTPWAGTPNPPPAGTPPRQVQPPGRYTPWQVHPTGRYTPRQVQPLMQVLPGRYTPWAGTPPGRYTPPWAGTPVAGTPTLGRYTPGNACWDTVNKRAVRILLECILVWVNVIASLKFILFRMRL